MSTYKLPNWSELTSEAKNPALAGYEVSRHNSFSGCDMVATCRILDNTFTLGAIQTLSYSVHMERKPIRSLGNVNAKDFVVGPRTIAGTLIFAVFDKHMLYYMKDQENKRLWAEYQSMLSSRHILMDELPPFDITVTYANEYGKSARLALYGVRLLDEGQVMSINDIYTENTYQYVATDIDYLNDDIGSDSTISAGNNTEATISDESDDITDAEYSNTDSLILSYKILGNNLTSFYINKTVGGAQHQPTTGIILINNKQYTQYVYTLSIINSFDAIIDLPKGMYTAQYQEDGTGSLSNILDIEIEEDQVSALLPPPVVLHVVRIGDDKAAATLYSDNFNNGHDSLGYYKDINHINSKPLTGNGEVRIYIPEDIKFGEQYKFYTYSSSDINNRSASYETSFSDIFDESYIPLYDYVNSYITDTAYNAAFNYLLQGQNPEYNISLTMLYSANLILEDSTPPFNMSVFDSVMALVVKAENEYLQNFNDTGDVAQGIAPDVSNVSKLYKYNLETHKVVPEKVHNVSSPQDLSGYLLLYRIINESDGSASAPYYVYSNQN